MLRASATWRLIGCSMKSVAAQSFCSAGSASIDSHSSTTDSTSSYCSLPSSVTCRPVTRSSTRRDPDQPVEIGAPIAAHLELEAALAVPRDDFLERLGQAIVDARPRRLVAGA